LELQITNSGENDNTLAEMRRLEQFIAEHSKRAEVAITERYQERFDPPRQDSQEPQQQK